MMVHYEGLGLDNIWLISGFHWEETGYGRAFVVDDPEALERAVADTLVAQDKPLDGQAFRFLRDMLAMTQDGFGKRFGRDYQTVARWEAARHKPVPQSADAMIRQLYSESRGARPLFTDVVEKLVSAAQHAGEPGDLQFAPTGNGGWRADVPAFA